MINNSKRFYNPNGVMAFQIGFNFSDPSIPISDAPSFVLPASYNFLQPGEDIFLQDAVSTSFIGNGIIVVTQGYALLASCTPIYNKIGIIAGYSLTGFFQKQTMIQDLADNTQQCVTGLVYSDTATQNAYGALVNNIQPTVPTPNGVWQIDPNSYQGSMDNLFMANRACGVYGVNTAYPREMGLLSISDSRDIYKPALIYRVDVDRTNLLIGIAGIFTTFGVLVIILILTSVVIVLFLDCAVLRKVAFITTEVEQITIAQDMHARVGNNLIIPTDELGKLVECINGMLASLEESSLRIQNVLTATLASEERARCIMNAINDFIVCVLTRDGTIKETNPAFAERFKSIEKYLHEIKLEELIVMSEKLDRKDGFFLTQFKEKVAVTITVTSTMIVVDNVPTAALVITAQNNTEQNMMKNRLKKMQDNMDFKEMWKNPTRRAAFRKFCELEKSIENVLFVEQVELYRNIHNVPERLKKQKEISEKFLTPNGEYQVNISAAVLEKEGAAIQDSYAQRDLFDKLVRFVLNMMASDTFRRFKLLPPQEQGIGVEEEDITTSETTHAS
jgi:PAS domain-containing protein